VNKRSPTVRPGRDETWLSIGDLTFHLVSDDRRLASLPPGRIQAFVAPPRTADVDIHSSWIEALVEPTGRLLFESGGAWRLFRDGDDFVFSCRSSLGGPEPYLTARFDAAFRRGDLLVDRRRFAGDSIEAIYPLEYPLDELLMVHLLSQGRGVEVHGCGVLDARGRAFVFAGQSGAGKSTIARLWAARAGVTVLSDERVVVRTDADRLMVYGTPWHGDALLASPARGELTGLFFLHHAAEHAAARTSGPLAVAQLMSCAFLPFYDREAAAHTLTAADRIVSATRCFDLRFAPDSSVIDLIEGVMA
jgi:hypothetical protein